MTVYAFGIKAQVLTRATVFVTSCIDLQELAAADVVSIMIGSTL
jgi:hypothetical protein